MSNRIRIGFIEFENIPRNKFLRWVIKINGKIRLFWGLCPLCNSDAPLLYDCKVCDSFHLHNRYAFPDYELKRKWWIMFRTVLDVINIDKNEEKIK